MSPHRVLNFLCSSILLKGPFLFSVNALSINILYIFPSFIWTSSPLPYITLLQSYPLVVVALNICCLSCNSFFCPRRCREVILAFSSFFVISCFLSSLKQCSIVTLLLTLTLLSFVATTLATPLCISPISAFTTTFL